MTLLELVLIVWQALLVAAIFWINSRMDAWIAARTRICQVALAFVASGRAYPDHEEFAMAILNGNHAALGRRFPGYGEFYAREIERMEEDDA